MALPQDPSTDRAHLGPGVRRRLAAGAFYNRSLFLTASRMVFYPKILVLTFQPFLIPDRVPHGVLPQDPGTDLSTVPYS